jgi:hypothetical protein
MFENTNFKYLILLVEEKAIDNGENDISLKYDLHFRIDI